MYRVKKVSGSIGGLKYRPSLEPERSDDADFFGEFHRPVPREFSPANQAVLREQLGRMASARCIVEIGVQRNPFPESSTGILLQHKPPGAIYIGVDIEDKRRLDDPGRGVYTLKIDSRERERVFGLMDQLGLNEIDLLFIDGWHSVNQCLADWAYTERLSARGTVVLHDTNVHPGPWAVFEAIDETIYEKQKYCTAGDDWGIAVAIRRPPRAEYRPAAGSKRSHAMWIQADQSVTIDDALRLQMLTPALVRIEERGPGGFEDRPTFFVIERAWPGAPFTVSETNDQIIVRTDRAEIRVPAEKPRVAQVRIGDPVTGDVIWNGATAEPRPAFPDPVRPGRVWSVADEPRIVPPPWGVAPPPEKPYPHEAVSGWDLKSGAPDQYVFLHAGNLSAWRDDFLRLTGRVPLPPLWAFGYWHSLYNPYTEAEALATIDEYRKRDYPLDVFVVDTDWRVGGSGGYEVEAKYFPDFPRFIGEAHRRHARVVMNDHPQPNGMQPLEPQMLEFRRAGLVKFLDMGMDAWWYDKNWFEIIDGPVTGLDREVWGQYLYWNITRAARPAARPMLMSMRSEHPASHRYPIWWTGDIPSTHAALREGIRDSVNDGVGRLMPYVSQDLGGHLDQPSEELYVRFLQYGCFSPITRVHGTRKDGLFRDPWRFGAEAAAIIRDYVKLRYRLMPVIYAAARRAYDEGFPILRPLTLEWPAFSEARTEDEYLFGDDLLVAPIHTAAENGDRPAARSLWIPPGEWEDLWTGAIIAGPRTIQVSAPLRQMPLYARRGGVVMLAPEMSYTGERPWDPVTLEIFPPDAGSVTRELYEDDGHSQEYQAAGWARTPVRVEAGASNVTIRILPTAGRFAGQLERRAWRARVRLKSGQVVRNVRLDGRNLDAGQDYAVLARKPSQMDPIPLRGWGQLPSPQAGVVVEIETQAAIHEARTIEVDL